MRENDRSLSPFGRNPIWSLQKDVNSLFDDFFQMKPDSRDLKNWTPSISVSEKDDEYLVSAEIPGMKKDDINLTLTDNSLIISGEKRSGANEEKDGNVYSEMSFGSFYRSIPFQNEVDPERVSAKMEDGVLKINVGKSEQTKEKTRRIDIH